MASSPDNAVAVKGFDPLHQPLLTLVAACAMQCVQYRSTEECLESLFSTPVQISAAPAGNSTAKTEASDPLTLSALYPEVRVLECTHEIRNTLRRLQECPPHAVRRLRELLAKHLDTLYQTLPDPLFSALAHVALAQVSHDEVRDDPSVQTEQLHLYETQTLQVVEKLQHEILMQTQRLTTRCNTVTLRYRNNLPF